MEEFELELGRLPVLIARSEVEKYFPGVLSRATLAKLASEGTGPPYLKVGRRVVYRTRDLLDWLTKQAVEVKTHNG